MSEFFPLTSPPNIFFKKLFNCAMHTLTLSTTQNKEDVLLEVSCQMQNFQILLSLFFWLSFNLRQKY